MKCMYVGDHPGPNPEFSPPEVIPDNPQSRADYIEYCATTPRDVLVPSGTVDEGPMVWVHCLPDSSGITLDRRGNPVRTSDGIIRAVPADDQCKRVVESKLARLDPKHKAMYDRFVKTKLPGLLEEIKRRQAEAETVELPQAAPGKKSIAEAASGSA